MPVEQTAPVLEQSAPKAAAREVPTMDRSARTYRILFYVAALVAIAATAMAWKIANRPVVQDLTAYAFERDKQYPFIVDAYGFKYQGHTGNILDEHVLRYGAWEKDRLFFVRDYLNNLSQKEAVVIDVGANTGHHSLFYSRYAERVLAFEPFPPVIKDFKQNLALNPHIKNVELFEVGLGDDDAELPFVAPVDTNTGLGSFRTDASLHPDMKQYEQKLRIVVGDNYLKDKNLGPVAFIKVDVEGFEEAVLKGLRQLLEKHRPLLQIEFSMPPVGTVSTFDQIKSLLPDNYEYFALPTTNDGIVKGMYRLVKLDPANVNKNQQIEVIACPRERLNVLPGQ